VDDSTPDPGDDTVTEGGGTEPSTEVETSENRPDEKVSSDDPEDGDDSESSAAPYDPGVSDSNDDASGGSGSGGNTQSSGTNPRSGNTPASGNAGPAFPNGGNASPSGNAGSAVSNAATQSVEDAIPIHPIDAEGNPIVPEENRYATIDDLPDNVIFEDLIPMGDGYFYDPAQGSFYFIGSESMAHTRIKDDKVPLGAYVLGRMGDDNLPTTILALIAILSGTGCIILYHRRKEEDD
jgi:hypothetical protein